jgi:hypothetical protein
MVAELYSHHPLLVHPSRSNLSCNEIDMLMVLDIQPAIEIKFGPPPKKNCLRKIVGDKDSISICLTLITINQDSTEPCPRVINGSLCSTETFSW